MIDENLLLAWDGSAWQPALDILGSAAQNMALLGLGTTADTSNPFSAKLNNALWTAKAVAEGGDGHLRYKLSKESAAKTLSLLFQDNYSGRAEIGLTGDDDFHFKVSADGSSWHDALTIDRTSGKLTFNQGLATPAAPFEAMAAANLALNADHIVSQESVDTAVTGIGAAGGAEAYGTDQWKIRAKGSLRVSGQRITSLSLPGIKYALRATITTMQSSLGSGDYLQVSQPIEGLRALKLALGAASAAPVAVGVYVRSSVPGTFAVQLSNSARNRSICKLVTIGTANSWTWVALAGSPGSGATAFPGDTSGSWLTDTGVGLRVAVTLAAGTAMVGSADAWSAADVMSSSAQTNLAATASATFDVTALCVFAGTELPVAGSVPLMMRPEERELALCSRYYRKSYELGKTPGSATVLGGMNVKGPSNAGSWIVNVELNPPMRAAPTVTLYDNLGAGGKVYKGGTGKTASIGSNVSGSRFAAGTDDTTAATELFFQYVADARF